MKLTFKPSATNQNNPDTTRPHVNSATASEKTTLTGPMPENVKPEYAAIIEWVRQTEKTRTTPESKKEFAEFLDAAKEYNASPTGKNLARLTQLMEKSRQKAAAVESSSGKSPAKHAPRRKLFRTWGIPTILLLVVLVALWSLYAAITRRPAGGAQTVILEQGEEDLPDFNSLPTTADGDEESPEHWQPFLKASADGNASALLQLMLTEQPPEDLADDQGNSLALLAAKANSLDTLLLLHRKKYPLLLPNNKKQTALSVIIPISKNIRAVRFLLQDVISSTSTLRTASQPDDQGKTPLHYAAENKAIDMTPLIFQTLFEIDVQALDRDGHSALDLAVASNNLPVAASLIRHGAEIQEHMMAQATPEMKKVLLETDR